MTIRELKGKVNDRIPVRNILISVFDKTGLETFVPDLIAACSNIRFMSTGGTYKKLDEMFASSGNKDRLIEVEQYTGFPEMEGGLVKTLHPKIHAGLLGERDNPTHQQYLAQMSGVFIDMVVVNLYPFSKVVEDIAAGKIDQKTGQPYNFETARGNIDIGGPTMLRAGAKNFPSCAAVCDPADYALVIKNIRGNSGQTTFSERFRLAQKVFETTQIYETAIFEFLKRADISGVREVYQFSE